MSRKSLFRGPELYPIPLHWRRRSLEPVTVVWKLNQLKDFSISLHGFYLGPWLIVFVSGYQQHGNLGLERDT